MRQVSSMSMEERCMLDSKSMKSLSNIVREFGIGHLAKGAIAAPDKLQPSKLENVQKMGTMNRIPSTQLDVARIVSRNHSIVVSLSLRCRLQTEGHQQLTSVRKASLPSNLSRDRRGF